MSNRLPTGHMVSLVINGVYIKFWTPEGIKALRNSQGLSQWNFAIALGVNSLTVSRWERGIQLPRFKAIAALSQYAQKVLFTNKETFDEQTNK